MSVFFAKFYKVTHVISRLKISVEFKNSQKRWIFGVNSWKLREKKFQWNSKICRKGEFLALILENYAWGQFLPCLTNSMSVYIKILLYQYNLVYLQFIRQKYHEKKTLFWDTSLILTMTMTCSPFIPSRNCWGELVSVSKFVWLTKWDLANKCIVDSPFTQLEIKKNKEYLEKTRTSHNNYWKEPFLDHFMEKKKSAIFC